ncbi:MAG TPA: single-stranded DNA-binding protein [Solirubrobacteraceae bacterium]|jgi:single-strand DNA-binding protein|nr:single-stranded DNA-binding protein [Solirubrobacteraceae bacterium]
MSSFSINRVVLVGRLTRDPELRSLPSGSSVCALRIACNESRLDEDGERTERPNYFDVSVFGAAGESVARFLGKGRRIGLDGRLQWREWETAEGQRRQAVSVVADVVQFLDSPGSGGAADGGDGRSSGGDDLGEGELVGVGADDLEVTF